MAARQGKRKPVKGQRQLDEHPYYGGRLLLYRREDNPKHFHARISIPRQRCFRKSTLETTLEDAYVVANAWYEDRRYDVRKGKLIEPETFETVFKRWLERQSQAPMSRHRFRYIQGTGARYLIPFFGNYVLSAINDKHVASYWDWRINFWKSEAGQAKIERAQKTRYSAQRPNKTKLGNVSKIPSTPTLKHEQAILRQFWKWAKTHGLLAGETPAIDAPKTSKPGERRPDFSADEWRRLRQFMDEWVRQRWGMNGYTLYHRELIRNYVVFMANSGLRPNEARQLRWQDVSFEVDQAGNDYCVIYISPNTKTGARECIPLKEGHDVLYEMLNVYIGRRFPGGDAFEVKSDPDRGKYVLLKRQLVFGNRKDIPVANFGKTFKDLLRKAGLLTDRFGRERTLYSLRHLYATQRLLSGAVPIEDLAQNLGTSSRMISKHYSHVTVRQRVHLHTGSLVPAEEDPDSEFPTKNLLRSE